MKSLGRVIMVGAVAVCLAGCRQGQVPSEEQRQQPKQAESPVDQTKTFDGARQPAVAGLFYPKDKVELAKDIDRYLAEAKPEPIKNLRGLVCPHAGYRFSGPTAAFGYKLLEGHGIRTVIVMAPSHYASFEGASIPDVPAYRTPFGDVPLSPEAAKLAKSGPFVVNPPCEVSRPGWWRQAPKDLPPFGEDTPHSWEHSLEVQLPLLQRTLRSFSLVPIVFGKVDPEAVAEALMKYLDEKTLLVASSDLSHHHPYDMATHLDSSCIQAICNLDVKWMKNEEACGKGPILALMHVAKKKGWKTRLLDYRNSGDVTGDKSSVVGYAAIAFFEPAGTAAAEKPKPQQDAYTGKQRKFLIELARKTITNVAADGRLPEVDPAKIDAKLKETRACFVTLTKGGRLRGCIGSIFPRTARYQSVSNNAQSAAARDPRFPAVEPDELDKIKIEISVLTLPVRLEFKTPDELLAKLRPNVDGVVLRIGRRQSTYLPQVWKQLPEKESFLDRLTMKAGLPQTAWRNPDTMILVYQGEAFEEESGGGPFSPDDHVGRVAAWTRRLNGERFFLVRGFA